jgi:hypothetical protein
MKKVRTLMILGLLLTFLTSAKSPVPPAKSSTLVIKGYVFKDDKKIDDAVVRLYQNNKVVQKTTSKKSKFQFVLFSDMRYMVEIDYDGCVSERIQISTKEKTEFSGKYLYEFRVDLMDLKSFKGVDISELDFPTALIKYSKDEGEYLHDAAYSSSVKKELKKLKAEAKKK